MLESLIAGALGGALGGKGADASAKIPSPGGLGSLITGGLGGLAGGVAGGDLLSKILTSATSGGIDIANIAGSLVGGGVLGTIVTAVVGMVMKGNKS